MAIQEPHLSIVTRQIPSGGSRWAWRSPAGAAVEGNGPAVVSDKVA